MCAGVPVEGIKAGRCDGSVSHLAPQQRVIEHMLCAGIVLGYVVTWRDGCSKR